MSIEGALVVPHYVVPGRRLSEALGRQHAITVLIALLDADEPLGATELTFAIEGYTGSGIASARHLQKHGLVSIKEKPGVAGKVSYRISLTATGRRVAEALAETAELL